MGNSVMNVFPKVIAFIIHEWEFRKATQIIYFFSFLNLTCVLFGIHKISFCPLAFFIQMNIFFILFSRIRFFYLDFVCRLQSALHFWLVSLKSVNNFDGESPFARVKNSNWLNCDETWKFVWGSSSSSKFEVQMHSNVFAQSKMLAFQIGDGTKSATKTSYQLGLQLPSDWVRGEIMFVQCLGIEFDFAHVFGDILFRHVRISS